MDGINCSVHFHTLKQIGYEESNTAVTFYHDRTHFDGNQRNLYAEFAENFNLQQGRHFVLHNRVATMPNKISKLKDQVKELDTLLSSNISTDQESKNIKNKDNKEPIEQNENNRRSSYSANELISNYFMSGLNSNISKLLWIAPNRILLIMQDGMLIWFIIDTISGDLVKILFDKTLIDGFGSHSTKLSGKIISDTTIIYSAASQSVIMVFVYSDKSKVDILKFQKSKQFIEYLRNPKESNLEKLSSFEPTLATSYDFFCPDVYLIEKKISSKSKGSYFNDNTNINATFSVWWVNDRQVNYQANPQTSNNQAQVISLLEKDDLRNNILVLSTNLADSNILEYMFKSDGLLLSLHYTNKNSLIAIEQTETNTQKYMITIYEYDLPKNVEDESNQKQQGKLKSPKIKLASFALNSKIATTDQIKTSDKYILMLSMDQTVILYEIKRNITNKFNLNSILSSENDNQAKESNYNELKMFTSIEWLLDDLLFCVYNLNGQLKLFDVSFNHIELNYMTRYLIKFKTISKYLNENLFTPFEITSSSTSNSNLTTKLSSTQTNLNNNRLVRVVSSRNIFTDSLWSCFHYSKGPFGLFRLSLPNNFNCVSLITHYIKNSQLLDQQDYNSFNKPHLSNSKEYDYPFVSKFLKKAVNLLLTLNWDEEPHLCLACLYRLLNFLISGRVVFNLKTESLIEEALGSFYKPKRPLSDKTVHEYKHQVSRYARKFFYVLLKNYSLQKAYLLAVDIGSKDLFNDLYYCALDTHENQLAEICRNKYHELLKQENKEKLRIELNRSITTLDDNIKGNYTEFDRYSISSSEYSSAESDNESYSSLNDYDFIKEENKKIRQNMRLNEENFKRDIQNKQIFNNNQPKFYTEDEIDKFTNNIFLENKFIYNLFDD